MLKSKINEAFKQSYRIIFSQSPDEIIMKGAAMYGLNSNQILERVSPITIGIQSYINKKDNEGKCEKQKNVEGVLYCLNFINFIHAKQTYKNNYNKTETIIPLKNEISIYTSFEEKLSKDNSEILETIPFNDKSSSLEVSIEFTNYLKVSFLNKTYQLYYPTNKDDNN